MNSFRSLINGIIVIKTSFFLDKRGKFGEIYNKKFYNSNGINVNFIQDNFSISKKNSLRGLHFRKNKPQAQLVTILEGEIYDVILDLREGSKTFGKWYSINLSANDVNQVFMDSGFAHGYFVKSDVAKIHYKVSELYDPKDDFGVRWNDPDIGIIWPNKNPFIKERDSKFPLLKEHLDAKFLLK